MNTNFRHKNGNVKPLVIMAAVVVVAAAAAAVVLHGLTGSPSQTSSAASSAASSAESRTVSESSSQKPSASASSRQESSPSSEISYKQYQNERYGFSIEYPSYLSSDIQPDNGDGMSFSSGDGSVKLTVSGENNILGDTPDSVLQGILKDHGSLADQQSEDGWCTASWTSGDTVSYEKNVVGKGSINTFVFSYPASQKDFYAPVIEHLNESFQTPGTDAFH